MRPALILAALLGLSAPAAAATPAAVLAEAHAYAYTAALSLPVAMVNNEGEAIQDAPCTDARLVIPMTLKLGRIESCTASVSGPDTYEVRVRFAGGLSLIADQNGVRQVESLPAAPQGAP